MISRIANIMKFALQCKVDKRLLPFPKIIVIVLDDDLLHKFATAHRITKPISRLINFIMIEHECAITAYKDDLPAKCLKSDWPQLLWIQVPSHHLFSNNNLHYKFNKALEEVAKLHSNMTTLMLKKVWDESNPDLYIPDHSCFSASGYTAYWEAVDRTVRYFDSVLLKK